MDPAGARPEYLTTGEAARMLGVSPRTVRRWAQVGRIPGVVRLRGELRLPGDVLRMLLARRPGAD